jgi:hypothetical protein
MSNITIRALATHYFLYIVSRMRRKIFSLKVNQYDSS